jgi:phage terminase large subunit-like protein
MASKKKQRARKVWEDKKRILEAIAPRPEFKMQPGPQSMIDGCSADLAFYGGAAFAGKSYYLLFEAAKWVHLVGYRAVIFRRTTPQITAGGGLWDTAGKMYPDLFGKPNHSELLYKWLIGSQVKFSHLENEVNIYDHQGAAYSFIGFDELTHFTRKQFFYLLSRNRNPDKFPPEDYEFAPYVRCTMNPDADSWIREFIDWWIDPVTGYVIAERSGVIKWFTVEEEVVTWVDEDWRNERGEGPKSFTFICGNIDDNPIGCRNDPSYRNNLLAQDMVTRERLLRGNWNITSRGGMFNPAWFRVVEEAPQGMRLMRYWDRAATVAKKEGDDPDWTAGALCGFLGGDFYVLDVKRFRGTPAENYRISRQTAEDDGYGVEIGIEQEPGSAGVEAVDHYMTEIFRGFVVHKDKARLHKEERAKPWAKLAEQGHVFLVKGEWNRKFCAEAGSFPFQKKDQIDAVSGAYLLLSRMVKVFERDLPEPAKMNIAWEKMADYSSLHYGAIVQKKDLSVWCVLALWDNVKCCLYVYDSWSLGRLIPSQLALMLKAKMQLGKYECEKILCNDMMDNDAAHVRSPRVLCNKELRELKCDGSIKEAIHFDAYGAIVAGNQLLGENRIFFDLKCKDVLRQMAQWKIENNKVGELDCGYAEALCIIVSELKKKQVLERLVPKRGDYVKDGVYEKALLEDKEVMKNE